MPTERKVRYLRDDEFEKAQREAEKLAQDLIDIARSVYQVPDGKNPSLEQIMEIAAGKPFNIKAIGSVSAEDKLVDTIFPTRNQPF